MLATRHVWFPLASNASYFELTEPRVGLEERIKQTALLADELFFEAGALDVSVGDNGMASFRHPPRSLTHDEMRKRGREVKKGAPFHLSVAPETTPGVPATSGFRTIIGGPLEHAFFVEYETLLHDWGVADVPWMRLARPKAEVAQQVKELARAADRQERFDRNAPRIAENKWLDRQIKKDLNLDLAAGAVMEIPVAVDEAHYPMLTYKAEPAAPEAGATPGARALEVWVPNFSRVPWPDVIALHDHDAVGAFRERLIEAEENVAVLPESEQREALQDLQVEALARKLIELMPDYEKLALDLGRGLLLDAISSVIPLAGTIGDAATGLAEVRKQQSEWTAVLLTLHARSMPAQD